MPGWNDTTKRAADWTYGERNYLLVKFWRVWLTLAALAVLLIAWVVVTTPGTPPPKPTRPTPVPQVSAAGWTPPLWVPAAVILAAILAVAAGVLLLVRRHRDRQLVAQIEAYAYMDDDDEDREGAA
jgi:hypothetical protein